MFKLIPFLCLMPALIFLGNESNQLFDECKEHYPAAYCAKTHYGY